VLGELWLWHQEQQNEKSAKKKMGGQNGVESKKDDRKGQIRGRNYFVLVRYTSLKENK